MPQIRSVIVSVFLLLSFSVKLVSAYVTHLSICNEQKIEGEEKESSEKEIKAKEEVGIFFSITFSHSTAVTAQLQPSHNIHGTLQEQYFAIPTPPPWLN